MWNKNAVDSLPKELNILAIWTDIFYPEFSPEKEDFSVWQWVIKDIKHDIIEQEFIHVYYIIESKDKSTKSINVLSSVCTDYESAAKEVNDFITSNIEAIKNHNQKISAQKEINDKNLKMFESKLVK